MIPPITFCHGGIWRSRQWASWGRSVIKEEVVMWWTRRGRHVIKEEGVRRRPCGHRPPGIIARRRARRDIGWRPGGQIVRHHAGRDPVPLEVTCRGCMCLYYRSSTATATAGTGGGTATAQLAGLRCRARHKCTDEAVRFPCGPL